jgi:MFS family permease
MSAIPAPLRRRDFRRLWFVGLISDSGDWLLLISLPILVFELTGSALHTSFAFLIELGPSVLLGPVAGQLADRWDRRRLLVGGASRKVLALRPWLAVRDRQDLPILYAVLAVEAVFTLFGPAKNALLPTLVPADELVSANSLVGLNQNLGRLVGGPLGGLLLAVSGLGVIVAVDLATFLISAALIASLRVGERGVNTPTGPLPPAGRAFGGVPIRAALVIGVLTGAAQGLFVVLFVVWVARELGGGAAEIGLLRGIQAVGSIVAGLVLATSRRTGRPAALIAAGAGAFGVVLLAMWNGPLVTTALPVYVALFILVGAPGMVLNVGLVSLIQEQTPDGSRGKVFGVFGAVLEGSTGLGILLAGLLGDNLGATPLLNVQALLCFAAAAVAGWPALARRDTKSVDAPTVIGQRQPHDEHIPAGRADAARGPAG